MIHLNIAIILRDRKFETINYRMENNYKKIERDDDCAILMNSSTQESGPE